MIDNEITPKAEVKDGIVRFPIVAELRIDTVQHQLLSGMSATAEIVARIDSTHVVVNESDVIFRQDSVFVELLDSAQTRRKRVIQLGVSDGIRSAVIDGLRPGQQIVKQ